MSMSSCLRLIINGTACDGESTIISHDREGSIECLAFEDSVKTAREASSGLATGDRTYQPIKILKRLDKSTPLIAKALCQNEVIGATWTFYRPNLAGDGTTEACFQVAITEGRVASIERHSSNAIEPASANQPFLETVSFVFHTISWTDLINSTEHQDEWSTR